MFPNSEEDVKDRDTEIIKRRIEYIAVQIVRETGPIKGTELALQVMNKTMPADYPSSLYLEVVDELVKEGRILELEYTTPRMPDRIKSMYFPVGSTLELTWKS